jgi:hypothetical protein
MTIADIIMMFENGNKFGSTIAINEYAKANNLGIGDVFREISYKILKWDTSYIDDRGFKAYVRMTVYYANNSEGFSSKEQGGEAVWYTP